LLGSITVNDARILVVPTPYDRGWGAEVDGKPVKTLLVDAGLLGLPLSKGQHKVVVKYTPPSLLLGATVSLASLILLAAAHHRWPRVAPPHSLSIS